MWQQPNCLLAAAGGASRCMDPRTFLSRAMSTSGFPIGVFAVTMAEISQWIDWLIGKLGGALTCRA